MAFQIELETNASSVQTTRLAPLMSTVSRQMLEDVGLTQIFTAQGKFACEYCSGSICYLEY